MERAAATGEKIEKTKAPTLADIAQASGVSYQTVSRVVNGHPHVAASTRERVARVVRELGYQPNRAARSLVTRRSHTVGVVSFGLDYYGPGRTTSEVGRAVRQRGYALSLISLEALEPRALEAAARELLVQQVDGLVLVAPLHDLAPGRFAALCQATPFVLINVGLGAPLPSVSIDQAYGARLAVAHLLARGHQSVAELHGPPDWVDAKLRHQGYAAALAEAGLRPAASCAGDWSARSGYRAMQELLRGPAFSALFAHNDQMALGALRAAREHGLRVPDDLSIIGFDNIPEAAFFEPPLSTVEQDFAALGEQSVDYLVGLMAGAATPYHQRVLYPKLVVRGSVADRGG